MGRAMFFGGFGAAGRRVAITADLLHIAWLGNLEDHRKTPRGE
jgi:hypothetical protein